MAMQIAVPDLGVEQAEVIELLVPAGATVKKDQPIALLESDKASLELPATEDGVLVSWSVKVGSVVKAGDALPQSAVLRLELLALLGKRGHGAVRIKNQAHAFFVFAGGALFDGERAGELHKILARYGARMPQAARQVKAKSGPLNRADDQQGFVIAAAALARVVDARRVEGAAGGEFDYFGAGEGERGAGGAGAVRGAANGAGVGGVRAP